MAKKILIRGGVSVTTWDGASVQEIIRSNKIGNNAGNLIYAFSVFRTLMTEDTEIVIDEYKGEQNWLTEEEIDYINQTYDAYVVPLADAFRDDFARRLNHFAQLFPKLKIPCYIIGVGLRTSYEPDFSQGFPFDEAVKNCVKAALEKSSMIGLRGEITAEYLTRLGFRAEKDFTVIGCPSMYTFGRHLEQKPLHLTPESRISVNYNAGGLDPAVYFLNNLVKQYPDSQYVGQWVRELVTLYIGKPEGRGKTMSQYYPYNRDHFLYKEDKVRYFVSAYEWINSMKSIDLSIGGRMHGNIAAILAGTPAIFMPLDSRMRELLEYHDLPYIPMRDVTYDTTLEQLLNTLDLQKYLKKHEANFNHFLDFLDLNGLDHIYKNDRSRKDAPLDALIPEHRQKVTSINNCTKEEAMKRIYTYYDAQIEKREEKIATLNEKVENLQKSFTQRAIKRIKRTLNMK